MVFDNVLDLVPIEEHVHVNIPIYQGSHSGAEAVRENFVYREMTDFAVYSREHPYRIVRVIG